MLVDAVESYLAVRRATGFILKCTGTLLHSFALFAEALGEDYVCAQTAIKWAGLAQSLPTRAHRLIQVIRFARYIRAEDQRHEVPLAVFGPDRRARPIPYIFSAENIRRLVQAASRLGSYSFRRQTYSTLFALLACTGLRVSEAIGLRYEDITPDGLVIRHSKFRKSRIVPLHETARIELEKYLRKRRPYAPFDDHVFVSLRRKPLLRNDVETTFQSAVKQLNLPSGPGLPRPTVHSLRHTFAVRALETCPDGRDRVTKHMLALSTYLGHAKVANTYWYLESTSELMKTIADSVQQLFSGGRP